MEKKCIACDVTNQQAPLLRFDFQDHDYYICPQHLPVLIHHPEELIGKIPDAEKFKAG